MIVLVYCVVFFLLCAENAFTNSTWKQCEENFCIPRIIWSHWNKDQLPMDVKEMVSVTRGSLRNFTYLLLTPQNMSNFLETEIFPSGYKKLQATGKSDYIRLCVLEKYGGLYIDSTTFVNSGAETENLFWQALYAKRSVFGFAKQRVAMKFLLELNFYGACEGSLFMKKYKEEYDAALEGNIGKYIWETNARLWKKKIKVISECYSSYFLVNNVFLRVIADNTSMADDVYMFPTKVTQYLLANECRWKKMCIIERLMYDPRARAYPFIKVSAGMRRRRNIPFRIRDNSIAWERRRRQHLERKKILDAAKWRDKLLKKGKIKEEKEIL